MTKSESTGLSLYDKILSDRVKFTCQIETLGERTIASPVRHH